ncbi:mechanosensitive ion channel family protein [Neorhizobium sp. Rsf11]|uniref:Mechanosensitive ion channel family protein n=2 Tax=Neorhizobium TaxID=1525371 RepID=A0ABV0M9A8_9HYPH|nr:mechanosensitive ion channel family protein [Neorhizobium petrolearium]MCC2614210.1 mechanosensitive ion channel family protein [Neorhizobium petrolearium]WGI71719.1 mechanosensitive ion channel family protein [Neorhizobium petrolearium]
MKWLIALFLALLLAWPSLAQTPPQQKIDDLVRLLQDPEIRTWLENGAPRPAGATAAAATVNGPSSDLAAWESSTRARLDQTLAAFPRIPSEISAAAVRIREDAVSSGYAPVFIILAGLLALGLAAEWIYRRTQRFSNLVIRELAPVAVFAITMAIVFFAFNWPPLVRVVLLAYISAFVLYRVGSVLIALALVEQPASRVRAHIILGIAAFAMATVLAGGYTGVDPAVSDAVSLGFSVLVLVLASEAVWSSRHIPVSRKILLTAFLVIVWMFWCLDLKGLFWLSLYALLLPEALRAVGRAAASLSPADPHSLRGVLIVRGARALAVAAALGWLALVWQFNPDSLGHMNPTVAAIFYGLLKSVVVLLIADLAWQIAKTWIDRSMAAAEQSGGMSPAEAARRARFRTLLPIFRHALAAMVIVMTGLIVLSELGVEIGPLLAGAGVFGVALGFGSQTLVKDVISGIFYMLDDAFRVGEYIQASSYKGTVEGFSLRSVRLRHHRGPVYTVPFGELGAVQNMSRDWAVVKFIISVAYDTDVAQVKKLTKAVGKELQKDPEFEPLIIETLKMKGVEKFGDYGIDLSFGMMLKPSQFQSMIRRRAYAMIREAFQQNGISFAHPMVQVGGEEKDGAAAAMALRSQQIQTAAAEGVNASPQS